MPSFNQQQLNYNVRNANSVLILIGDQEVGFGQTFTDTLDYGAEGLYGIGSSLPQEIQQLKLTPSLNVDYFQLTDQGLKTLGYPSTMAEVLANNSFNISMIGEAGTPLATYVGCVASNKNLNVPANQVSTESIAFLALDILDPLGQSVLNSNSVLKTATTVAGLLNISGI